MIVAREAQGPAAVAGHYDELDPFYREIWGEHVHHGLWTSGEETVTEAVAALSRAVAGRLALRPGLRVVDIGCGYGGTARLMAREHGVEVTGLTLSAAQAAAAAPAQGVTLLVRDWLDNGLESGGYDAAYAIESSEHMEDKPGFFAQAARVLRPGARMAVCAWLAREDARGWEIRHLLEPICREGRMPSMGTAREYRAMAQAAGFTVEAYDDVSARVARTWTIILGRVAGALLRDARYRRFLLDARAHDRIFALSLPRLALAYRTGAMRYGMFTLVRR